MGLDEDSVQRNLQTENRKEGCDSKQTHEDDYVVNLFSPLRLSMRSLSTLMGQRTMNNMMKTVSSLYTFDCIVGNVGSKFNRTRNITPLIPVSLLPV